MMILRTEAEIDRAVTDDADARRSRMVAERYDWDHAGIVAEKMYEIDQREANITESRADALVGARDSDLDNLVLVLTDWMTAVAKERDTR